MLLQKPTDESLIPFCLFLVLTVLFQTGCHSFSTLEHSIAGKTPTYVESGVFKNRVSICGLIRRPGTYEFYEPTLSVDKLIDLAGGLTESTPLPALVAIYRDSQEGSQAHFVPASWPMADLNKTLRLTPNDRVEILSLRQSSLGRQGIAGRDLAVVNTGRQLENVANVEVDGEPIQLQGSFPKLSEIVQPNAKGSVTVLRRYAQELRRVEYYYLPENFRESNSDCCFLRNGDVIRELHEGSLIEYLGQFSARPTE